MEKRQKRVYSSKTRLELASQTRSQILKAAKKLFEEVGFDRVTIGELAKASQVSMPTIYAIFKSKKGVLQALIDDALPEKQFLELVGESMNETSPSKRLSISAKLSRKMYDAEKGLMDILRGALVVAPEFKELEKEREKRRHDRQSEYVKKLMQDHALKEDLTLEKARDILWALTGRDLYRMLVIEQNWTSDEYEQWLAQTLTKTLLKNF